MKEKKKKLSERCHHYNSDSGHQLPRKCLIKYRLTIYFYTIYMTMEP
jgi:hypothetical protein